MKDLKVSDIFQFAEAPVENVSRNYHLKQNLLKKVPVKELLMAFQQTDSSDVRQLLAYILGIRRAKTAIPALIEALSDLSPDVRSSAAEALAKIGNPKAGEWLLKYFVELEKDAEIQKMLVMALGAVGYQPAIPVLMEAVKSIDPSMRGTAAWSLGALKASEAIYVLQNALTKETEWYPQTRMKEAIEVIMGNSVYDKRWHVSGQSSL